MNFDTPDCPDCDHLLAKYEAATFAQAKIHNALDIAGHLRDRDAVRRLTLDAYEVTARRRNARQALAAHRESAHAATHEPVGALATR